MNLKVGDIVEYIHENNRLWFEGPWRGIHKIFTDNPKDGLGIITGFTETEVKVKPTSIETVDNFYVNVDVFSKYFKLKRKQVHYKNKEKRKCLA